MQGLERSTGPDAAIRSNRSPVRSEPRCEPSTAPVLPVMLALLNYLPKTRFAMSSRESSTARYARAQPLHFLWGLLATLLAGALTAVAAALGVLASFTPWGKGIIDLLARVWGRAILLASGARVRVEGLEHLDPAASYVLASNHTGFFDVFGLLAAPLPFRVRFVAKSELLQIPIFGQALARSAHIVIDRSKPDDAIRTINEATSESGKSIGIVFFAEGTRSADARVGPFKKGAASLAILSDLALVPLSVSGAGKFMPRSAPIIRPGGRIRLRFHPPLSTRDKTMEDRDPLTAEARGLVIAGYDRYF